jgi:YfiR/HmsC-like
MGILSRARRFRAVTRPGLWAGAMAIPALWILSGGSLQAKGVSLEYQVKAAYLFNFAKFIEWPPAAQSGPLTICVAGQNPFGDVLEETLRGEMVNGRPLAMRVIAGPEPSCHVVFVPQGAGTTAYLRAAQGSPILTVGETADFLSEGGIIRFVLEAGKVRFQIDSKAAERAELRISSHLLRLARTTPEQRGES